MTWQRTHAALALFIGGPADGQWLHVPLDASEWDVSFEHYRREGLRCGRHDMRYFVVETMSSAAAIECLLRGYQRPVWPSPESPETPLVWVLTDGEDGTVLGVFPTPQLAWTWLADVERGPRCVPVDWALEAEGDGDYVGTVGDVYCYSLSWFELSSETHVATGARQMRTMFAPLYPRVVARKD